MGWVWVGFGFWLLGSQLQQFEEWSFENSMVTKYCRYLPVLLSVHLIVCLGCLSVLQACCTDTEVECVC